MTTATSEEVEARQHHSTSNESGGSSSKMRQSEFSPEISGGGLRRILRKAISYNGISLFRIKDVISHESKHPSKHRNDIYKALDSSVVSTATTHNAPRKDSFYM